MSNQRFAFGRNWKSFLAALDQERIEVATDSLRQLLGVDDLHGRRFLDLGCGSGLFSLAAHRLGADVVSIDYDEDSVACTQALMERRADTKTTWIVRQGSAIDRELMESLGSFDVVYAWGVLHHTGRMDQAIELASQRVVSGGLLCLAIYNDQGSASRRWLRIKQIYNGLPSFIRPLWVAKIATIYEFKFAIARLVRFQNPSPLSDWRAKKHDRGMSASHDWVDWVGGLPFEVATPERIEAILASHEFTLVNLKLIGKGWGCNEFVFKRVKPQVSAEPSW